MMPRLVLSMTRATVALPLMLAALIAAAGVALLDVAMRLAPSGSLGVLVGDALLSAADKADAGEVLANYPPNTLLPLIGMQALTGLPGFMTAHLLSVLIGAALGGLWLRGLLRAGYRPATAVLMALLLCLNPLALRAVAEGPELMLALAAAWLFASSAFGIRSRGGINDLMLCSGSLLLMVFSGQSGILLAIATLPFLTLIMPADIRARSWFSVYTVLLFPVVFAVLGFMLVNWMMLHDPLAFIRPQLDAPGEWFAGSWQRGAAEITFAVASAPILVGMVVLTRTRRPAQAVAMALLGTAMLLALLTLQTGVGLSLAAALSPTVGFVAAAAMSWPVQERRAPRVTLLLMLGFLGGGSALLAQDYAYASGSEIGEDRRTGADRALGAFLKGRSGVLIDAAAHPQVVAARGSAAGLIAADETAFELAMLRRRIGSEAREVAVAAPDPSRNADAVGRIMPAFYADGQAGFRLIYDRNGWRVWSRQPQQDAAS